MELAFNIKNPFSRGATDMAHSMLVPQLAAKESFDHKKQALETAHAMAQAEGRRATLEDYRSAAEAFGKTEEGQALTAKGEWSPKIYADLSGQDIQNFTISEPHKRSTTDFMDQDGDHTVNDFYSNIDFHGANIKDCVVDPATSFNDELAKAASIKNINFNNMQAGDPPFTFGSGQIDNITLTNIKGGEIFFSQGSQVNNLDISGVEAKIHMEPGSSIDGIKVDEKTRILNFKMEPGSLIANADLQNATIDMDSKLKGVTLQNVQIHGNMVDVDMQGSTLRNVSLSGSLGGLNLRDTTLEKLTIDASKDDIKGLDLTGAKIKDLKIDGKPITNKSELKALGITVDDNTGVTASPQQLQDAKQAKMEAAIGKAREIGMKMATNGISSDAQPPAKTVLVNAPVEMADALDTVPTKFEKIQIQGGTAASFNNIQNVATTVTPPVTQEAQQKSEQASREGPSMDYYRQMSATNGAARSNG